MTQSIADPLASPRLLAAARTYQNLTSPTTQSAVNSQRSARVVLAFSIALAMLSFDKFWLTIRAQLQGVWGGRVCVAIGRIDRGEARD